MLSPCLFRFLMFLAFAAFQVAFVLVVTVFATVPARYRAAEVVLMLDLLTILGLLLPLKLQEEGGLSITVMGVA